jgi:hypothetical protein
MGMRSWSVIPGPRRGKRPDSGQTAHSRTAARQAGARAVYAQASDPSTIGHGREAMNAFAAQCPRGGGWLASGRMGFRR